MLTVKTMITMVIMMPAACDQNYFQPFADGQVVSMESLVSCLGAGGADGEGGGGEGEVEKLAQQLATLEVMLIQILIQMLNQNC